jgi:hypothetical protein
MEGRVPTPLLEAADSQFTYVFTGYTTLDSQPTHSLEAADSQSAHVFTAYSIDSRSQLHVVSTNGTNNHTAGSPTKALAYIAQDGGLVASRIGQHSPSGA